MSKALFMHIQIQIILKVKKEPPTPNTIQQLIYNRPYKSKLNQVESSQPAETLGKLQSNTHVHLQKIYKQQRNK